MSKKAYKIVKIIVAVTIVLALIASIIVSQ